MKFAGGRPTRTPIAVLLGLAALAGGGTAAEQSAIAAFSANPRHCLTLAGGTDYIADGAGKPFAQALAAAIVAIGGPVDAALARINAECATRRAATAVPDRPKPSEAL